MKQIQLTRGKFALIDDEDFELISQYKWCYKTTHDGKTGCAVTGIYKSDKKQSKIIRMSRFLLNAPKDKQVDHINGNPLDNRRNNLRLCNNAENNRNKLLKGLFKCVYAIKHKNGKNRYYAKIKVNYKSIYLGSFDTKIEAAKKYNSAAILYHKEFSKLNII